MDATMLPVDCDWVVRRFFPHPAEDVFAAWTDPEAAARWLGPLADADGASNPPLAVKGEHAGSRLRLVEAVPARLIVLETMDPERPPSLLTVEIVPVTGGCVVTILAESTCSASCP